MSNENFISETEAATMAGVSINTLMRFAEAGYLQIENDQTGQRLFSKSEIRDLFGVMGGDFYDKLADDIKAVSEDSQKIATAEVLESMDSDVGAPEPQPENPKTIDLDLNAARQTEPPSFGAPAQIESQDLISLRSEVSRLKNLMHIQEKILDLKDAEIHNLREERAWLRTRVEKLEQKADRDQLLLLSETQTVRRLITLQENRKSGFRSALEWFGLITPTLPAAEDRLVIDQNESKAA